MLSKSSGSALKMCEAKAKEQKRQTPMNARVDVSVLGAWGSLDAGGVCEKVSKVMERRG